MGHSLIDIYVVSEANMDSINKVNNVNENVYAVEQLAGGSVG